MPADLQPVRTDSNLDIFLADTGQLHADPQAGGALEHIDLRPPLRAGFLESREVYLGKLVGNFTKFALNETEAQGADFSAHNLQWMG